MKNSLNFAQFFLICESSIRFIYIQSTFNSSWKVSLNYEAIHFFFKKNLRFKHFALNALKAFCRFRYLSLQQFPAFTPSIRTLAVSSLLSRSLFILSNQRCRSLLRSLFSDGFFRLKRYWSNCAFSTMLYGPLYFFFL